MMGRSWKYSKGHSSGFVPDYRHAVETMGESEGFGNLTRMDVEVTASEASYASNKRKNISLNVDGYNGLSVPMQVLSLSKMSRSEKKSLESKLKMELDQVRGLQKKINTLALDAVVLSPSSEIRSCSDGPRKPPLENSNRLYDVSAPAKKRVPPQMKKNVLGRFQPAKPAAPSCASNAMVMKSCENLLGRLMTHQYGWVFNEPVDVVKLNIPDYFNVIKHPMDLGTIKRKIALGEYSSPLDFAADIRLTFSNALTYNPAGNDVHLMAETLRKFFEVRWKSIVKKIQAVQDVQTKPGGLHLETEIITPTPPLKKKKVAPNDSSVLKPEPVRQVISPEEKQKLGLQLEDLLAELPESILYFLKEQSEGQGNEEEIEIDMDALSDDTFVTLRKLVNDYLQEKEKNQSKAEPCEIELRNESGFSNCSVQPCKGNGPVEEDVDIMGGNNPPFSSFPPVEIEKEVANKNSKPGSPSSSSSESGSSSSDSDSSSDSEADSPKASVPPSAPEKNEISASSPDLKRSDPPGDSEAQVNIIDDPETEIRGDSETGNRPDSETGNRPDSETGNPDDSETGNPDDSDMRNPSVPELPQAQQSSHSQPMSVCEDDRQDGESAPSERPVSPEKQYRAALLRNRFADTILKAREKALEKGEKRDPEKLQKDKEELERRKKEEKARLQAEATAAEEARRKAEQEAAVEARKKRELEREAARQALQMMEKTVDINENSRFLEDLEMLRTAADGLESPNFEEEASPELSQNGLGSFKLQGNALEQLGLYMKVDDDFEEEEPEPELEPVPEPQSEPEPQPESEPEPEPKPAQEIPEQPKDVEEGEID